MQRIFLLLFSFLLAFQSFAQDVDSLLMKVNVTVTSKTDAGATLSFTATLPPNWHLYDVSDEDGVNGVTLQFPDSTFVQEAFSIAGEKLQKHDPVFEKEMAVYESPLQ